MRRYHRNPNSGDGMPAMRMPELPIDVVSEILAWLPGKELCRCKCVSKPWREMIGSRKFMEKYQKRQDGVLLYWPEEFRRGDRVHKHLIRFFHCPFGRLFKPLEVFSPLRVLVVAGSRALDYVLTEIVDGLLCVVDEQEDDVILTIHNICTGDTMRISNPRPDYNGICKFFMTYDPASRTYKLLSLLFEDASLSLQEAHIMSLRLPLSTTWRLLDFDSNLDFDDFRDGVKEPGSRIHNHGVLCWFSSRDGHDRMLCFDSSKERFMFVEFPQDDLLWRNLLKVESLFWFKDRLALWGSSREDGYKVLTCYVQEDDEGNNWKIMKKHERCGRLDVVFASGNIHSNGVILVMNLDSPGRISSYSLQDADSGQAVFSVGKLPHGALFSDLIMPSDRRLSCFIEGNNLHLPLSGIFRGAD